MYLFFIYSLTIFPLTLFFLLSEEEILIPHSTVSHFTSGLTTTTTGSESVSQHFTTTTTTPFDTNLNSFLDHDNNTDTSLTGTTTGSSNTTTTSATGRTTGSHHHALEEEVGSMAEHKDIISGSAISTTGSTNTQQNSTSFVRMQQFHENLQHEEEETVMVSNELVPEVQREPEVEGQVQARKNYR